MLFVFITTLIITIPACFIFGYRYREMVHLRKYGNTISKAQSIFDQEEA